MATTTNINPHQIGNTDHNTSIHVVQEILKRVNVFEDLHTYI